MAFVPNPSMLKFAFLHGLSWEQWQSTRLGCHFDKHTEVSALWSIGNTEDVKITGNSDKKYFSLHTLIALETMELNTVR